MSHALAVAPVASLLAFAFGYLLGRRRGRALERRAWLLRRRRTRPTTHYTAAFEREIRKESER